MKKRGFTLIELLVAVAILGIIAVVGSNMFFTILKGTSKTKVLTEVKQNGDYVMNVMERMIRNARGVKECETDHIKIQNPGIAALEERQTTFKFHLGDGLIASESAGLTGADARITNKNVRLISGSFDCVFGTEGASPDKVTISFTLSEVAGTRPEEKASANFQTTVVLRNY